MIEIATTAVSLTGLPWHYVLWELPVAITYQLHILYWQREGNVYLKDQTARIKRRLIKEDASQ